jgi:hypothetical protein
MAAPAAPLAAQEVASPPSQGDVPNISRDAPECVTGHVGAQPVKVCLYADGTAIAWRSGGSEPLSLGLKPPGAQSWIFDQAVTNAACNGGDQSLSDALQLACTQLDEDPGTKPANPAAPSVGSAPGATTTTAPPSTTPAPNAGPTDGQTYQTRNGLRTATQLHDELVAAGYGGPWDVDSMLSAYNRVTISQSAATPLPPQPVAAPARHDYSGDCQAFTNSLPNRINNKIALLSNITNNCLFYANRDGSAGLGCFENVTQREFADAIIYSVSDFDSRYHDCLGH